MRRIFTMLVCSVFFCSNRPQDHPNNVPLLDQIISGFEMRDASAEEATAHILISNHISGGVALSFKCDALSSPVEAKRFFSLSGIPLRQALDQLLSNDRSYRWSGEENIVVISPVNGMPELLNTKIDHFEIDNPKYTLSAASGKLLQLPEI